MGVPRFGIILPRYGKRRLVKKQSMAPWLVRCVLASCAYHRWYPCTVWASCLSAGRAYDGSPDSTGRHRASTNTSGTGHHPSGCCSADPSAHFVIWKHDYNPTRPDHPSADRATFEAMSETLFTHEGWFGICPVWIADPDGENIIKPKYHLGWLFAISHFIQDTCNILGIQEGFCMEIRECKNPRLFKP